MKITMLGVGYVGLVSGTCFSEFGFDVCCVDKNKDKITNLEKNIIPIYEPGLENLVKKNKDANRLTFSIDIEKNIADADVVFIAVGTPARRGDGHADLSYIYEAAEEIGKNLIGYTVVVTKSTVPVGTGNEIKNIIKKINPKAKFDVVSNPEFLREGNAIEDFMRPDRVVVGYETEKAKGVIFYKGIGELPFIQQATISIWKNNNFINDFAYKEIDHAAIIKKTRTLKRPICWL